MAVIKKRATGASGRRAGRVPDFVGMSAAAQQRGQRALGVLNTVETRRRLLSWGGELITTRGATNTRRRNAEDDVRTTRTDRFGNRTITRRGLVPIARPRRATGGLRAGRANQTELRLSRGRATLTQVAAGQMVMFPLR